MLHFAQLAQDDRQIAYWSTAAERTMRWFIRQRLADLSVIESARCDWSTRAGSTPT